MVECGLEWVVCCFFVALGRGGRMVGVFEGKVDGRRGSFVLREGRWVSG